MYKTIPNVIVSFKTCTVITSYVYFYPCCIDFLVSFILGKTHGVWIGYSDIIQTKPFLALSDAKIPRYTHWNPREPNNLHGVEHCAIYLTQHDAWNDGKCNDKWLYVCKK